MTKKQLFSLYLPYGVEVKQLNIETKDGKDTFTLDAHGLSVIEEVYGYQDFELVLKPLESFKQINSKEMNDLNIDLLNQINLVNYANKLISFENLTTETLFALLENHVNIFHNDKI